MVGRAEHFGASFFFFGASKYMLDKWQELIYETITYMHCHMTVIQKWIRRFIASRHVIRKRQMITNRMLKSIQRTVNFFGVKRAESEVNRLSGLLLLLLI